jgi:D-glycero-alpha-D-manno-heptose 1-phosphate guanylyltransferase
MKEVVILAGGLGTRLKSAVPDLPKCMADVNGKPFLDYVIQFALDQGVEHFIFSLGYKSEIIIAHLELCWPSLHYEYCVESIPLGTGGGISLAASLVQGEDFFVLNGDTIFLVSLTKLAAIHIAVDSLVTIAVKPMANFDRYGTVVLEENLVTAFQEKRPCEKGLINGGVYIINKNMLLQQNMPEKYSFEKEILERLVHQKMISAGIFEDYFIDIGIPDDYKKAMVEFPGTFR